MEKVLDPLCFRFADHEPRESVEETDICAGQDYGGVFHHLRGGDSFGVPFSGAFRARQSARGMGLFVGCLYHHSVYSSVSACYHD